MLWQLWSSWRWSLAKNSLPWFPLYTQLAVFPCVPEHKQEDQSNKKKRYLRMTVGLYKILARYFFTGGRSRCLNRWSIQSPGRVSQCGKCTNAQRTTIVSLHAAFSSTPLVRSQTCVSTPLSLGIRIRGVTPELRSLSNSKSWPMKFRFGDTTGRRLRTYL